MLDVEGKFVCTTSKCLNELLTVFGIPSFDESSRYIVFVDAVQEKLLSEYEAELKTKKPTHAKKDSNASDDWEKLSDAGK